MGNNKTTKSVGGLRAVFGCTYEALALFRISLGVLLVIELATRFRFLHPFYSDEGTLPLRLLLPKIDWLYKATCLHVHLHELWQTQLVLGIQVVAAVLFTVGYRTKFMTVLSWYLYLSLTLRNTWLNFILDRYFHYLLFYAMFLPLEECYSLSAWFKQQPGKNSNQTKQQPPRKELVVNAGTIALKCLVFWIYLDAGGGKYLDPLEGWTYHAKPLPALDTYTRHTTFARYMYGLMGPEGLRVMTPTVVYVELLAAPVAFLGCFLGSSGMVKFAVGMIWQLHLGIALCMNNAFLLSLVANSVWCIFLPVGWDNIGGCSETTTSSSASKLSLSSIVSTVIVLSMVAGNFWFETVSESCDQTIFYSTFFHCRWNVFVGAEEYVTWEIAPGLLADGSIVDVWGQKDEVDWRLPGAGAPCTSTSRPGRWRSYPYLAELEGEDGEVLWSYLCHQWDRDNNVEQFPGRKLIKFNFFMLQADVLPNMGFSATRKRLIHSHECVKTEEESIIGEAGDQPNEKVEEESSDPDVADSLDSGSAEGDQRDEAAGDGAEEAALSTENEPNEPKQSTESEERSSTEGITDGETGQESSQPVDNEPTEQDEQANSAHEEL